MAVSSLSHARSVAPQLVAARRVAPRSGTPLRVVMVVANDVTRDSRVLREAGALARAGHRVTIIGMMTARSTAPVTEEQDGFVIWRLPYRARPPGWWVPPDFHARLMAKTLDQLTLRRASLADVIARFAAGDRALPIGEPRWLRSSRSPDCIARIANRISTRLLRPLGAVRRAPIGYGRLTRRMRSTPVRSWPEAARRILRRRAARRRQRRAYGRKRAPFRRAWKSPHRWSRLMRIGFPDWSHSAHRGVSAVTSVGGSIRRTTRAWIGFVGFALWASAFVVANRISRGGVEWLTGWSWRWFGWAAFVAQHAPDADVWHGHDLTSLPAVVRLKRERGGLAVYDSHELYVESGRHARQPEWAKRRLGRLERRLVREVDATLTVNQSIRDLLATRLGTDEISVLHNCPWLEEPHHRSLIREALELDASVPLVVYHGSLAEHRGVEQLLEAVTFPSVRDVHLAFLGYGPMAERIRSEATDPRFQGRVHLLDGVPPSELLAWLTDVDVAVVPIQPSTVNHVNSSPNKVFEALAVGTPIAGSDFPEFRRVVIDNPEGPLGELFDPTDPAQIAAAIDRLTSLDKGERGRLRDRCRDAARRRWNWQVESAKLIAVYRRLAAQLPDPQHVAAAA